MEPRGPVTDGYRVDGHRGRRVPQPTGTVSGGGGCPWPLTLFSRPSGFPGQRGVPGLEAPPGEKGVVGGFGAPGLPGAKGLRGDPGPAGYRGYNGESGRKGRYTTTRTHSEHHKELDIQPLELIQTTIKN